MGGTFKGELHRSAELLVDVANNQGVYYAIAFVHDIGYTHEQVRQLLDILKSKRGAIKGE